MQEQRSRQTPVMNFFRKNPLFAFVLTLCALLVLGEIALIYERFTTSRAAA